MMNWNYFVEQLGLCGVYDGKFSSELYELQELANLSIKSQSVTC